MSDVLFNDSGALPSGASNGSSVEQLNDEVYSSGSLASGSLNYSNEEQSTIIQDSSGSFNASVPEVQYVSGALIYNDSGTVNGLATFNNNFVALSFVIIILLSAIFGTLLFSLLKDFFKW